MLYVPEVSCDSKKKRPRSEVALYYTTRPKWLTTFSKSCTAVVKSADATNISI